MATAPATATTPPAGDNPFEQDQGENLADVFGFDSDTPSSEPPPGLETTPEPGSSVGAEGGEDAGGTAAPASEPPATTPSTPAEPPAVTPPTDEELRIASLEATIAELKAKVETPPAPAAAPTTTEETPAAPVVLEKPKPTNFKLAPEMASQIFGEDPDAAAAGISALISGVVDHNNSQLFVVLETMQAYNTRIAELEAKLAAGGIPQPGATSTPPAASTTPPAEDPGVAMRNQYFEHFPQHNNPAMQPILHAVAAEMAAQFPGVPWDAKYIASLGARVTKRAQELNSLLNPSTPPSSLQPGARSAVPGPGDADISDEIMETLGL